MKYWKNKASIILILILFLCANLFADQKSPIRDNQTNQQVVKKNPPNLDLGIFFLETFGGILGYTIFTGAKIGLAGLGNSFVTSSGWTGATLAIPFFFANAAVTPIGPIVGVELAGSLCNRKSNTLATAVGVLIGLTGGLVVGYETSKAIFPETYKDYGIVILRILHPNEYRMLGQLFYIQSVIAVFSSLLGAIGYNMFHSYRADKVSLNLNVDYSNFDVSLRFPIE